MKNLQGNYSLKSLNTFNIDVKAEYYFAFENIDELTQLLKEPIIQEERKFILGGGSNLLFLNDFYGIVLHPTIKGINIVQQTSDEVLLKVGAGENWDELVKYTVEHNFGGLENLTLIPGSVGAAPVQNIGAYGTEVEDIIHTVDVFDLKTLQTQTFTKKQCEFAYRNSIFKGKLKGKALITYVTFKLTPNPTNFNIQYGSIKEELRKYPSINLATIRQAIKHIRETKLPDPKIIPNAGSFFKNPVVPTQQAQQLKKQYPDIPVYPISDDLSKIAAGWLIEQCRWKGKQVGNVATYSKQALVIINKGNATGTEIISYAHQIQKSIRQKFDICLEMEVNVVLS